METANANGIPVVIYTQPIGTNAGTHPYAQVRKDLTKQMAILGSVQIVFGTLCIMFEVVCVVLHASYYLHSLAAIGYGFWIGIFFIITGAFGCAAGTRNNRGFIITFNVLSIISATLNVLLIIFTALSIVLLDHMKYFIHRRIYPYSDNPDSDNPETLRILRAQKASISMESLMMIIALAEAIVALWSAVVCCKIGACCCDCGDACCCPPAVVPTQVILAQQPFGGTQQQPFVLYTTSAVQQPDAYVNKEIMVDPNIQSETDIEAGDLTKLCI